MLPLIISFDWLMGLKCLRPQCDILIHSSIDNFNAYQFIDLGDRECNVIDIEIITKGDLITGVKCFYFSL